MNEQKPRDKKRKTATSKTQPSETLKSAAERAKRSATPPVDDDAQNASGRIDPAYEKLEEAGQTLRNVVNEVTEKAEEVEKKLRDRLSDTETSLKDELARTEDKIRENPLLAVGIAAAAGLIVGLLLNRNQ
jgi:ElaB/YqjD/DUF883 family membrane-anchored ribosome-binding protein